MRGLLHLGNWQINWVIVDELDGNVLARCYIQHEYNIIDIEFSASKLEDNWHHGLVNAETILHELCHALLSPSEAIIELVQSLDISSQTKLMLQQLHNQAVEKQLSQLRPILYDWLADRRDLFSTDSMGEEDITEDEDVLD